MTVTDLAHEAAKHYSAVMASRECVHELLEILGVPAAWREPTRLDALITRLRRAVELQLLERFSDAEIAALAGFYSTPDGRTLARKGIAFTAALGPMLQAEIVAWARSVPPTASADGSAPS